MGYVKNMRTKKIMIATLFSVLLLVNNISLANPVSAAKNCDDLLLQDKLATAEFFSCTKKTAEQGDAKAQFNLGTMYHAKQD